MKKLMMIAFAALTLGACGGGNKSGENGNAAADSEQDGAVKYITYTNENYGYSVEVPDYLTKRETLTEDNGTIFSDDGAEGATFNRIDISGSESLFVEEYTPEKVREDFVYYTENKEVTDTVCGDNYFTYTVKGDITEINYSVYSGNKSLTVTICYEADHEKKLGGEVADHVFKSAKFN